MNPSKRKNEEEEEEKKEKGKWSQPLKPPKTRGEIRREKFSNRISNFNFKVFHTRDSFEAVLVCLAIFVGLIVLFLISLGIGLGINWLLNWNVIDGQVRCKIWEVVLIEGILVILLYLIYRYFYSEERDKNGR